mgnify:CR=1 FL=1
MNFIFFSPQFPSNNTEFCYHLHKCGANVLGIGDVEFSSLNEKLKLSLTEYYKINDMENYDEVFRAVAFFSHKYGKIDRFESLNEYWLRTEAKIRTDFNIYGTKMDFVSNLNHKSKMKDFFHKANVETIKFLNGADITSSKEFINIVGYPVIIKPDLGSGSAMTYKISSNLELDNFFNNKPENISFIIEEFIDGIILTYDGLVDKDGNVVFAVSHEFDQSIMDVVNTDNHLYYFCLKEINPDLETAGQNILKAFDVRERFFHIELFKSKKEEKIIALEVNMRPPGAWMTDAINFSYDIDIYKEWASMVVKNEVGGPYPGKYYTGYAGRKKHKYYVHSHEEILQTYLSEIVNFGDIEDVFSRAMGNSAYQFRSINLETIKEIVSYIHLEK